MCSWGIPIYVLFLYFCHLSSLLVILEHEGGSHALFKHAQIYRPWVYITFWWCWCSANSISLLWISCNDSLHYSHHIYNPGGPVMQATMYSITGHPYDHANSPGLGPRSCLSNLSSSKKVADTVRPPKNLPPRSTTDCDSMPRREHF